MSRVLTALASGLVLLHSLSASGSFYATGAGVRATESQSRKHDSELTSLAFQACGQLPPDEAGPLVPLGESCREADVMRLKSVLSIATRKRQEGITRLFAHMLEDHRIAAINFCLHPYNPGQEAAAVTCLVNRGGLDPDQTATANQLFAVENTIRGVAYVCEKAAGNFDAQGALVATSACPVKAIDFRSLLTTPRERTGTPRSSEVSSQDIAPESQGVRPREPDEDLKECGGKFQSGSAISERDYYERVKGTGLEGFYGKLNSTNSLSGGYGFANLLRAEGVRSLLLSHVETNGDMPDLGSSCREFREGIEALQVGPAFSTAKFRFELSSAPQFQSRLRALSKDVLGLLKGHRALRSEIERFDALYREGSCRYQESSLPRDQARAYANCGWVNSNLRSLRHRVESTEEKVKKALMVTPYLQAGMLDGGDLDEQARFAITFAKGDSAEVSRAMGEARSIIARENRKLYDKLCAKPDVVFEFLQGFTSSLLPKELLPQANGPANQKLVLPYWMELIKDRALVQRVLETFPEYVEVYECLRERYEESEKSKGILTLLLNMGCAIGTIATAGALGPPCAFLAAAQVAVGLSERAATARQALGCQIGSYSAICDDEQVLEALAAAHVNVGDVINLVLAGATLADIQILKELIRLKKAMSTSVATEAFEEVNSVLRPVVRTGRLDGLTVVKVEALTAKVVAAREGGLDYRELLKALANSKGRVQSQAIETLLAARRLEAETLGLTWEQYISRWSGQLIGRMGRKSGYPETNEILALMAAKSPYFDAELKELLRLRTAVSFTLLKNLRSGGRVKTGRQFWQVWRDSLRMPARKVISEDEFNAFMTEVSGGMFRVMHSEPGFAAAWTGAFASVRREPGSWNIMRNFAQKIQEGYRDHYRLHMERITKDAFGAVRPEVIREFYKWGVWDSVYRRLAAIVTTRKLSGAFMKDAIFSRETEKLALEVMFFAKPVVSGYLYYEFVVSPGLEAYEQFQKLEELEAAMLDSGKYIDRYLPVHEEADQDMVESLRSQIEDCEVEIAMLVEDAKNPDLITEERKLLEEHQKRLERKKMKIRSMLDGHFDWKKKHPVSVD